MASVRSRKPGPTLVPGVSYYGRVWYGPINFFWMIKSGLASIGKSLPFNTRSKLGISLRSVSKLRLKQTKNRNVVNIVQVIIFQHSFYLLQFLVILCSFSLITGKMKLYTARYRDTNLHKSYHRKNCSVGLHVLLEDLRGNIYQIILLVQAVSCICGAGIISGKLPHQSQTKTKAW